MVVAERDEVKAAKSLWYLEKLLKGPTEQVAEDRAIDSGMGDDQQMTFGILEDIEKSRHRAGLKVLETFTSGGTKPGKILTPILVFFREMPVDVGHRLPLPFPEMDFPQGR